MDWHGISAVDAWASVTALATLLNKNPQWCPFGFSPNTRLVLMGHSNGGQGAWHIAAREPDRVLAGKLDIIAGMSFLTRYILCPCGQ